MGRRTLAWLRDDWLRDVREVQVEGPDPTPPLSNTGKLLAYVRVRDELLNVRLVRDGHSPCFSKYGHPRCHRAAMEQAERWARREGRGIWGDPARRSEYERLAIGWLIRAGQVEGYRRACDMGHDILDARLDYDDIVQRARAGMTAVLFADLVRSYHLADGTILFQLGSPHQPLCALFPEPMRGWAGFFARDRAAPKRSNYFYLTGGLSLASEQPQIVIESPDQISTAPPEQHF